MAIGIGGVRIVHDARVRPVPSVCGLRPCLLDDIGIDGLWGEVECFARRLQTQERMTDQIAQAMLEYLDPVPLGVGVLVRAVHGCMACRGVSKCATLITSALHGAMRNDAGVRAEFMALAAS